MKGSTAVRLLETSDDVMPLLLQDGKGCCKLTTMTQSVLCVKHEIHRHPISRGKGASKRNRLDHPHYHCPLCPFHVHLFAIACAYSSGGRYRSLWADYECEPLVEPDKAAIDTWGSFACIFLHTPAHQEGSASRRELLGLILCLWMHNLMHPDVLFKVHNPDHCRGCLWFWNRVAHLFQDQISSCK